MPRNQMPMQRPQMPPGYYHGPMPGRQPVNPMMGWPPQRQMGQQGGLLAKILGKGNKAGARGGLGGFGVQNARNGGSLLKSLANPSTLNGFFTNTQKVLNTAQQVGPMIQQIQQYGPIVKNLPAMWKLYRGLKDSPDQTGDEVVEESSAANESKTDSQETKQHNELVDHEEKQETKVPKRRYPSPSKPKMYI
jgi:hypothetical protein